MERPEITYATGVSGLKIVHRQCPGTSEYCGVTVGVGSRDETNPESYGLAHFVEHTIFKGTSRRSDTYIINRMEAVGGELNAFTTKEETTIYSAMPAGNFKRATDLIAELVTESVFPKRKIDREREVIADEIDSYMDSPADAVYDLFDEMVYESNPMAHNILGDKESIQRINSETCLEFLSTHFTADNMVYFYLGPASADKVIKVATQAFSGLPETGVRTSRISPKPCAPINLSKNINTHQTHTVMGAYIGGLHSPNRFATALAVNIIGGPGMNSRLNMSLRERRGLVYTVEASTALYSDSGMMTIYFGCDHQDVELCSSLCSQELHRLASEIMSTQELARHSRQFIGQLTLGADNKEQMALSTGRATLHGLPAPMPEESAAKIRAITPEALQEAAVRLSSAPARVLTLN